jgi:glycerol-3-phosphate dehydrogenase (NAD(P)+)
MNAQKIMVVGGGAWGTAMAHVWAQKGHDVTLWSRNGAVVASINTKHVNDVYLPDAPLDKTLQATADLGRIAAADIVVMATPTQYLDAVLSAGAARINPAAPVLVAAKGVEKIGLRLPSQIVAGALPQNPVGVITGPSFAIEVAHGLPAALTLAFQAVHAPLAYDLCDILGTPHFRLYVTDDVMGAEIGGAVKNVMAIACGIAHGKNMGDNARAALITRGLAEMVRLGVALGADAQTFLGLSGIGDLTLTCNAMQSRNFSLGVAIGQGGRAVDILAARTSVAEGYYTADAVVKLAARAGVDMPICSAVYDTLYKEKAIDYVIKGLLGRPMGSERRT